MVNAVGIDLLAQYGGGKAIHFASHLLKSGWTVTKGVVSKGGKKLSGTALQAEIQAAALEYKKLRGVYNAAGPKAVGKASHGTFGSFYKQPDGTWWSKDLAGHGGSRWKVFRQDKDRLTWIHDADKFGDYIVGKHKGSTGLYIPQGHLNIFSGW